ncbi:hypothetical protein QE422_003713 [Chryseobacterium sp. SORGH_AS 447]|nr:hypothetical protein [Chryseobacterium sp. SORGH_AS_0447]
MIRQLFVIPYESRQSLEKKLRLDSCGIISYIYIFMVIKN